MIPHSACRTAHRRPDPTAASMKAICCSMAMACAEGCPRRRAASGAHVLLARFQAWGLRAESRPATAWPAVGGACAEVARTASAAQHSAGALVFLLTVVYFEVVYSVFTLAESRSYPDMLEALPTPSSIKIRALVQRLLKASEYMMSMADGAVMPSNKPNK